MSDHPHGLTHDWTPADVAADLITLRRVLERYEALSWWQCLRHPHQLKAQLVALARYAYAAVEVLASDERHPHE